MTPTTNQSCPAHQQCNRRHARHRPEDHSESAPIRRSHGIPESFFLTSTSIPATNAPGTLDRFTPVAATRRDPQHGTHSAHGMLSNWGHLSTPTGAVGPARAAAIAVPTGGRRIHVTSGMRAIQDSRRFTFQQQQTPSAVRCDPAPQKRCSPYIGLFDIATHLIST